MERAEELFERLRKDGVSEVRRLIAERQSESYFIDFKRSANRGGGAHLHQKDRENLAKAISGFGNGIGGLIIWGVATSGKGSGDFADTEEMVENPSRFCSLLEDAVGACTVPAHNEVSSEPIPSGDSSGFVVTYIPASTRAPHQAIAERRYYMRAGSSHQPVPHEVLAGMFGKRPNPRLVQKWVCQVPSMNAEHMELDIGFLMINQGPVIARDLYAGVRVFSIGGARCKAEFEGLDSVNWSGHHALSFSTSFTTIDGFRLAPLGMAQPLCLKLQFNPPFTEEFSMERIGGCEGSPPSILTLRRSPEFLRDLHARHKEIVLAGSDHDRLQDEIAVPFLENVKGE